MGYKLEVHQEVISYGGCRYLVTVGIADSDPTEAMTITLASFAVTHKRVRFFSKPFPLTIDESTGAIEFENEEKIFKNRNMIAPIEALAITVADKKGKPVEDLSQLCIPLVEDDPDDEDESILVIDPVVLDAMVEGVESDEVKGDWDDMTFNGYIERYYYARSIQQLTRAEMKQINAISLNVISKLEEKDSSVVERIMELMNEDAKAEAEGRNSEANKTDSFVNMEISVKYPDLADELREVQIKQMLKRMSLMMKLPVELLESIYDNIPNGNDIIDTIDRELRGVKEKKEAEEGEGDTSEENEKDPDHNPGEDGNMTADVTTVATAELIEDEDGPIKVTLPKEYSDGKSQAIEADVEVIEEDEEPTDDEGDDAPDGELDESGDEADAELTEEKVEQEKPPARKTRKTRAKRVKKAEPKEEPVEETDEDNSEDG